MVRLFLAALVALLLLRGSIASDDNDPIGGKLRAIKAACEREMDQLKADLSKRLKTAEDAAIKNGDKPQLDKVREETAAFEEHGEIPSVISSRDYQKSLRAERKKLEDAYLDAIRKYTKAKRIDDAESMEQELDEFRLAARIFQGTHYEVVNQQVSWHDAEAACRSRGGHLAIIRNEAQATFLAALVKASPVAFAFIGATDERKEGRWIWVDGTALAYANWDLKAHQPNNRSGNGKPEHFAAISKPNEGKWWDLPAEPGLRAGYICQWDR